MFVYVIHCKTSLILVTNDLEYPAFFPRSQNNEINREHTNRMDRRKIAFLSRSLYFRIDRDQRSRCPGDTLPFSFLADRNLGASIDNEYANDLAGDRPS